MIKKKKTLEFIASEILHKRQSYNPKSDGKNYYFDDIFVTFWSHEYQKIIVIIYNHSVYSAFELFISELTSNYILYAYSIYSNDMNHDI